jgi:hypothetical protein
MTGLPRLAATIGALVLLAAAADMSNVQQVGDALTAGSRAANPRTRAAAAEMLVTLGAAPADGQEDMALSWRKGRRGVSPAAYRDRILGPVYHGLTLDPGAAARFEQSFYAGRTAHVAVVAVDRAPAALQIFDDEGKARCAAARTTCEWVPSWTSRVRVEVQNKGIRRGKFFVIIQ